MTLASVFQSCRHAALGHLACSALVAAAAGMLLFLLWYPWPYSVLAGGMNLFVLICGVDVVIGPLITLVIFDSRKPWPKLRRDLIVVVLLQMCALGYGLHVIYNARPVALALEGDRFRVVRAGDVASDELPQAPEALRNLSLTGPVMVRVLLPVDPAERMLAVEQALAGADLGMRPRFWRPWDAIARQNAIAASQSLGPLRKRYDDRRAEFETAIARTGFAADQLRYVPLLSQHANWIVLVESRGGEVVGYAPFNAY